MNLKRFFFTAIQVPRCDRPTCALLLTIFLLTTMGSTGSQAQEDGDSTGRIHYSYAHSGTGFFSIGGESTQVVRIPIAFQLRLADEERWGLKLRFPLSFGVHDFEIRQGLERPLKETVKTVALTAGIEFEIPARENWRLKPYAEAGFGKRISGSEKASLYRGGVKSLWLVPRERLEFRLGTALKVEGFELFDGKVRDWYGIGEVGAEIRWPAGFLIQGNPADFGAYLIARHFLPEIELAPPQAEPLVIENQLEVGFTFGSDPRISLWGLRAPRIGIAYRWGDGLEAFRINFGFPF